MSCLPPHTSNPINHLVSLMSTVTEEGTVFHFHLPNFILHGPPFLPWRPWKERNTFSVDPRTLVKAPILWNMTLYPVQSPHSSTHSCPLTITQWWRDMFADTPRLCTRSWTGKCGLHQMAFNCPPAKRNSGFNSLLNAWHPTTLACQHSECFIL